MKITKEMHKRLSAQAEEAKHLKLNKVASNLNTLLSKASIKNDFTDLLSKDALDDAVQQALWKIALSVSEYFDATPDAERVQKLVDVYADQLFNDLRVLSGSKDGVGAFEDTLPGELIIHEF